MKKSLERRALIISTSISVVVRVSYMPKKDI